MKRFMLLLVMVTLFCASASAVQRAWGWAEQGNAQVFTSATGGQPPYGPHTFTGTTSGAITAATHQQGNTPFVEVINSAGVNVSGVIYVNITSNGTVTIGGTGTVSDTYTYVIYGGSGNPTGQPIPRDFQQSFPQATVTVYITGTGGTKATLYSDTSLTPLSNPFVLGISPEISTTGYWYFYAADGHYDVQFSGTGVPSPFTLGDIQLATPSTIDSTTNALVGDGSGNAVAASGTGTNCLQVNGGNAACGISGTVTVSQGGTGDTTLTAHAVLIGEGTSPVATAGPGTSGYVLTSNGAGADPTFQAGGGSIPVPLTVSLGGTGDTTLPQFNTLVGNATGAVLSVAPGSAGGIYSSNGPANFPSFVQNIFIMADGTLAGATPQFAFHGATMPAMELYGGYDTTNDFGYIQSTHAGISDTRLELNPNGGPVHISTYDMPLTSPSGTNQALKGNGFGNATWSQVPNIFITGSALKGDGFGNFTAVTGTGTNCVLVNGTSTACGGGGSFVYVGALSGIPATCTVGQLSFITDATAGQNQYNCTATNTWTQNLNSGASGANTALSNLAAVSINTSLLAQTGVDLGSAAKPFRNAFLFGAGTYGTTSFELTGTPTAARTVTLPDATDTVVELAVTQTLSNKTIDTGNGNVLKIAGNSLTGVRGNTTTVQLASGAVTTGHCADFDANGNLVDAGAVCANTSPQSATFNIGSQNLTTSPTLLSGMTITAPATGTFQFTAQILVSGGPGSNTDAAMALYINGSQFGILSQWQYLGSGITSVFAPVVGIWQAHVNIGDTIEIRGLQQSSGAWSVTGGTINIFRVGT